MPGALGSAWQSGAISRDTLLHNLRAGEVLPLARTNEQEMELIRKEPTPVVTTAPAATASEDGRNGWLVRPLRVAER